MGAAIPIWADGASRPARVRLIRGKAELRSAMDIIVKKLDSAVNFRSNQFKVGQSEWGTMTFNGKNHCVLPLAQTGRCYAQLNEYFGKLRRLGI